MEGACLEGGRGVAVKRKDCTFAMRHCGVLAGVAWSLDAEDCYLAP